MPLYEYEHLAKDKQPCPTGGERFECFQAMSAPPLETCPDCGARVRRVLSAPRVHGQASSVQTLSNRNLAEKGFTKYVKSGDGYYEKKAGKGPDVIRR